MARIGRQLFTKPGWRPCPCGNSAVEFGQTCGTCRQTPYVRPSEHRPRYDKDGERMPLLTPTIVERAERIIAAVEPPRVTFTGSAFIYAGTKD